MKISTSAKIILALVVSLSSFLFYSCHKDPAVVLGNEEFIHYIVNGTPQNYDMPPDTLVMFQNGSAIIGIGYSHQPAFVIPGSLSFIGTGIGTSSSQNLVSLM